MYRYPANLTKDTNGTPLVKFRDVPEAITYGETREEALRHAQSGLETALAFYIDAANPLPRPTPARRGEVEVEVSARAAMKLALYEAYRAGGVTKTELARRMGIPKTNVDRLFSLTHASRVDVIESAAAALGKRLVISMRNLAAALLLMAVSSAIAHGQVSETFSKSCNETWRAAVESYRNAGLTPRQLDREGGTALLRPTGGVVSGLADVTAWTKRYATRTAILSDRLQVEVSVTFSPREGASSCRVWVGADMVGINGAAQTDFVSNHSLEKQILQGIRRH